MNDLAWITLPEFVTALTVRGVDDNSISEWLSGLLIALENEDSLPGSNVRRVHRYAEGFLLVAQRLAFERDGGEDGLMFGFALQDLNAALWVRDAPLISAS